MFGVVPRESVCFWVCRLTVCECMTMMMAFARLTECFVILRQSDKENYREIESKGGKYGEWGGVCYDVFVLYFFCLGKREMVRISVILTHFLITVLRYALTWYFFVFFSGFSSLFLRLFFGLPIINERWWNSIWFLLLLIFRYECLFTNREMQGFLFYFF